MGHGRPREFNHFWQCAPSLPPTLDNAGDAPPLHNKRGRAAAMGTLLHAPPPLLAVHGDPLDASRRAAARRGPQPSRGR